MRNIKTPTPQSYRVWDYLSRVGSISPLEAMVNLGGMSSGNLTKRISELRQAGVMIHDKVMTNPATHTRYKRYFLVDWPGALS